MTSSGWIPAKITAEEADLRPRHSRGHGHGHGQPQRLKDDRDEEETGGTEPAGSQQRGGNGF